MYKSQFAAMATLLCYFGPRVNSCSSRAATSGDLSFFLVARPPTGLTTDRGLLVDIVICVSMAPASRQTDAGENRSPATAYWRG